MRVKETKTILVTGASGFIGSFIVEHGLEQGMEVWAAVRKSSSRRYLQDKRIRFIELDLSNADRLSRQLANHKSDHGAWDYVVHAAGITKSHRESDFELINTEGTRTLVEALRSLNMVSERFVYLSSLSVFGPIKETACAPSAPEDRTPEKSQQGKSKKNCLYEPILESDTPKPNTAYGRSKLDAENYLRQLQGFPVVILRPTGVYGPREKDYFLMVKSIKQHIDFAVGFKPQRITFVYVKDLVQAVYLALEKGKAGRCYFVSDGNNYSSRAFSDLIQERLGIRNVLHITAPLWLLNVLCFASGRMAQMMGRASTLNEDKYNIMKQRNWQCDINPLREELGYSPKYDLRRGVDEAIAWYKKEKWI